MKPASLDQWEEIADSMRSQFLKMTPYMPAMKPEELGFFIQAAQRLEVLERDIKVQEAEVQQRIEKSNLIFHD